MLGRTTSAASPATLEDFRARLSDTLSDGNGGFMALCPCHDDHAPSLHVWIGEKGDVAYCCLAGCEHQRLTSALKGLGLAVRNGDGAGGKDDWTPYGPAIASYPYSDERGTLLFTVCRTAAKQFPMWVPDTRSTTGKRWKLGEVRRVLYRLPRLLQAVAAHEVVVVCEGEKDVEALERLGVVATCSPGGAGKWRDEYAEQIGGADRAIILPDNDEAGREHARKVAASLGRHGVRHVTVELPGLPEKGDVSDWICAGGSAEQLEQLTAEALARQAQAAAQGEGQAITTGDAGPWQAIDELSDEPSPAALECALRSFRSACEPLDHIARQAAAGQAQRLLKERHVTAPGECVRAALPRAGADDALAGVDLAGLLADPEPWGDAVAGAELLGELCETLRRHVVISTDRVLAAALWVLFSHCLDAFEVAPLLCLTSPVKRCAKTRLAELVARLVPRPLAVANLTPAAAFRAIEKYRPTLLFDEADRSLNDDPELNGILNAGHTRDSAHVMRCVGEQSEPRLFSIWAAKLVAGIGRQAGTLEDRSIMIELQRKRPDEQVAPLRQRDKRALEPLRRRCARWAADHRAALSQADPELPDLAGNDRAADNWQALIAIADEIGGDWPPRARAAAERLTRGAASPEGDGLGILLLGDLRDLFAKHEAEKLFSTDILKALNSCEERPWAHYRRGDPLDANAMARLLKDFKVQPGELRISDKTGRGYKRLDCAEAFARYLHAVAPETPETVLENRAFWGETRGAGVSPHNPTICRDVSPVSGSGGEVWPQTECEIAGRPAKAAGGESAAADFWDVGAVSALRELARFVAARREVSLAVLAAQLDLYPAEAESALDTLVAAGVVGRSPDGARPVLASLDDVDRLVGDYLLHLAHDRGAVL